MDRLRKENSIMELIKAIKFGLVVRSLGRMYEVPGSTH
jgi:hypothetical protein